MLREVAAGVWVHDIPHKVGPFELGARMTVLKLSAGGLVLVSPLPVDAALKAAIEAQGAVRYIIAPSLWHSRFTPDAKAAFPDAKVLGAPGLRELKPKLPIDAVLGGAPDPVFDADFSLHPIGGMPSAGEIGILHRPSRTLVLTDAVANFRESKQWFTRQYLKWGKALGRPAQTLFLKSMVKDKAALKATRDALCALDWDRLVVAHGEVVETGGKDALKEALNWL